MKKNKVFILGIGILWSLFFSPVSNSAIISIDLNDFFADPTVTVTSDGNSALMAEDPIFLTVLLSNDPFFGDPGISVPMDLLSLDFNYDFTEGPVDNDDDFFAVVFDGNTGDSRFIH